ncbi:MAG: hypothetical protein QNJ32_15505 [Xenococcaceae cyanobacterium MO_167.B27]|nr:hypothetical protein [Xenococcaceae cyanobacterium MO_167.B27]
MPVVSNSSPLVNLAIIDRLILVKQQFGKIIKMGGGQKLIALSKRKIMKNNFITSDFHLPYNRNLIAKA